MKSLNFIIFCIFLALFSLVVFLQYLSPCLYGVDGYYHIRLAHFIKDFGPGYRFLWARFSTFKNFFADKDFLLHLFTLPFTFVTKDIIFQGKLASLFFAFLFLFTYTLILKKYAKRILIPYGLLSLALCPLFLSYLNYLRPMTLVNILILILLYFLIEGRTMGVFCISLIYPLTHISFPLVLLLSLGTELLRFLYMRKFLIRSVLYSFLGLIIGLTIHPHYPNNILSLYLNGFLVPLYILKKIPLRFGVEFNPLNTRVLLFDFFVFIIGLFSTLGILLFRNLKIRFSTIVFFAITFFFFLISLGSLRFWYHTIPLGIIFLCLFFSDFIENRTLLVRKIFLYIAGGVILAGSFFSYIAPGDMKFSFQGRIRLNLHYENMARLMKRYIPEGKIVYHGYWSDSPYFVCLNPKNYYLVILDPIYMYYYNKEIWSIYRLLVKGKFENSGEIIKRVFKTSFGYLRKSAPFYKKIKDDKNIEILIEDKYGLIFKIKESSSDSGKNNDSLSFIRSEVE